MDENTITASDSTSAPTSEPEEKKQSNEKAYLKAMPLRSLSDLEGIKAEVAAGNILIIRITPLAAKSIDDVKKAVSELFEFVEASGGDIARLGEERIVLCPQKIRIWREKTPVQNESLPTVA